MKVKDVAMIVFNLILISGIILYFFAPGEGSVFSLSQESNDNFSIGNNTVLMQFYENMRFPTKTISYRIDEDCSLPKRYNMIKAFEIMQNQTVLEFYEVNKDEEIFITCEEIVRMEDGLFIAGEGGPTNITETTRYKVILRGEILLIKDSDCERPNVEIHELLHVLGFDHSENKNNILYPITRCKQTIGEEIPALIEELYSDKPLPDLRFEKAEAAIDGHELNLNISVRNDGLHESENAAIVIYADEKALKEIPLKPLEIGHGLKIELSNLWLTKTKIEELKVIIEANFDELDYINNEVLLSKK